VYQYRTADKVCTKCERAIKLWGEHCATVEAGGPDTVVCRIAQVAYAWPGFYFGGRHDIAGMRELRDRLPDLFHALSRALAVEVIEEAAATSLGYAFREGLENLFWKPARPYPLADGQTGWFKDYAKYTEANRDLFRELYDTVARLLEAGYLCGVQDGRDILGGLAAGQTTIDELNEQNVTIGKAVQEAGRRQPLVKRKRGRR
jgi:hypothetical protein